MSDEEVILPKGTKLTIFGEEIIGFGDEQVRITLTCPALDAKRYQWLRDNVFDVLCEGRPADCVAKWMLPRLVAEDGTGRKYTFDEIIDMQMKRGETT